MNTNPNAKSLIFTNLPFELESIILNYYREIRSNAWHETLRLFSTRKLAREMYIQSEMQDHYSESFGNSNSPAYKREMFRLYKIYLPDYNDSLTDGIIRQEFYNCEGHAIVNMSILLNDVIDKKIITTNYASHHDIIESLDIHLPFKSDAVQDIYDEGIIKLWKRMSISEKEKLIHFYFQAIKDDCLKNYGMVNSENIEINIRESAYRILRFAFINDSERFKINCE